MIQRNWCAAAIMTLLGSALVAGCASDTAAPITTPSPAGDAAGNQRYVIVQPGESLRRIAHAQHVSVQALAAANRLTPPYRLQAGARLVIPSGAVERTALATPAAAQPASAKPHPKTAAAPGPAKARHAALRPIPLDGPPSAGAEKVAGDVPAPAPRADRLKSTAPIPLD